MNLPGQWIFRVGQLAANANIEQPDVFDGKMLIVFILRNQCLACFFFTDSDNGIPRSCSTGATDCHVVAKCIDYDEGFCCSCKKNYYGNGKYCVKSGKWYSHIQQQLLTYLSFQMLICELTEKLMQL